MKLDKAIKDLQARVDGELYIKGIDKYEDMELGIRALKLVQREQFLGINSVETKLPGETEEWLPFQREWLPEKENEMTEYERVRQEALLTDKEIRNRLKDSALQLSANIINEIISDVKRVAQAQLDNVLKADGIEIRAADQRLPGNPHSVLTDRKWGTYGEGQQDMLRAGFIKVIPKPKRNEQAEGNL